MVIVAAFAAFYFTVFSGLQGFVKAIIAIAVLAACSLLLQRLLRLEGEMGLLLFKTRKGLGFLDWVARRVPGLWNFLADFGIVIGFGLFSLFIFKRRIPKMTVVAGMIFLLIFWLMIFPLIAPLSLQLINLSGLEKDLPVAVQQTIDPADPAASLRLYLEAFISLVPTMLVLAGGLAFLLGYLVVYNAVQIVFLIAISLYSMATGTVGSDSFSKALPGVSPILPGINIQLAEGVIALAIILIVHEGAHAVVARVAKIPLKSAGIVMFGFLPFGAFVDPDEDKLKKMDDETQNRVIVAGSASNLYTATLFFFVFLAFNFLVLSIYPTTLIGTHYVLVDAVAENGTAYGVITPGMVLTKWNGVNVTTLAGLQAALNLTNNESPITISTANATFTPSRGNRSQATKLLATAYGDYVEPVTGIQVTEKMYGFGEYVRNLAVSTPYLGFLYNFLGLVFVLNILVGMVNLLPIPPFDGYRILQTTLGEKALYRSLTILKAVVALIVVSFILNAVPWLWR
ncbi:Peptidase family M50 [uncultured archaeon]|nr:Peptidase family M50 [uncultured archaeon]